MANLSTKLVLDSDAEMMMGSVLHRPAVRESHPRAPLVVHVIHRLSVGGLENGLVNLVNRMPGDRYRHAIVCMTDYDNFRERIERDDVDVYAMHRDDVGLARTYWRLYRLFSRLQPAIVHSRNLSGLDALLPALGAGVRVRIHGEHGRDVEDLDGSNPKYRRIKRSFRPLVTHYTTVSRDLAEYLENLIHVPRARVSQICNGVDTERFRPREEASAVSQNADRPLVVGTVGRLQPVKDQVTLVRAFAAAVREAPVAMRSARLLIVGDGPMRTALEAAIGEFGLHGRVDLVGSRLDVPELLRAMDVFVLPSLAEGISNTILEAMASGLPVIATRVGGNGELVEDGRTGALIDAGDWRALTERIVLYATDRGRIAGEGREARERAVRLFSLNAMVDRYTKLYDNLTLRHRRTSAVENPRAA